MAFGEDAMTEVVVIPKAEYEKLLAEIAELKKTVEELAYAFMPVKSIMEKLPDLMNDLEVFKLVAPVASLLYVLDVADLNALQAATHGGIICTSKALRKVAENGTPRIGLFGLLSALRDPEVQRGLGMLIAILKNTGSCLEDHLKQIKES